MFKKEDDLAKLKRVEPTAVVVSSGMSKLGSGYVLEDFQFNANSLKLSQQEQEVVSRIQNRGCIGKAQLGCISFGSGL